MENDITQQWVEQAWTLWFIKTTASEFLTTTESHILLPVISSNTDWKQNIQQYAAIFRGVQFSVCGFILHSQHRNPKEAKWKACGGIVTETGLHHKSSGKVINMHTYTEDKHKHGGSSSLNGCISCCDVRIWNDSPVLSIWLSLHVNHKRRVRALFSHCIPQTSLMCVDIGATSGMQMGVTILLGGHRFVYFFQSCRLWFTLGMICSLW